uniref:DUF4455 domain-containing protein n=1 Tax=Poecilia formosa TaxID=48698 RepID=A0A096ME53_POEFO
QIKKILKKQLHLLQQISFLSPPDVHRLIHAKAMMLNQSLLANRRSSARLVLLLQDQNLQQEFVLRLHWEESLDRWRKGRVEEMLEELRFCLWFWFSPSLFQNHVQQQGGDQMLQNQEVLVQQRSEVIYKICSLVPPTGSSALVSNWFNELMAVNQQIAGLHADMREQLQRFYEDAWQRRRAEAQRCQEALAALQLSDQQLEDITSSRLLPLIGQRQRDDEERLAGLDQECSDCVDQHVLGVSRSVSEVMRAVALLWETHCRRLKRREEELEAKLQLLKKTQKQLVERMMVPLESMLVALRQESREEFLDMCLEQVLEQLKDIQDSIRPCLSQQWDVLDQLPAVLMEELYSYSNAVSSFFKLSHPNRPVTMETYRHGHRGRSLSLTSLSLADLHNVSVSSNRTGSDLGQSHCAGSDFDWSVPASPRLRLSRIFLPLRDVPPEKRLHQQRSRLLLQRPQAPDRGEADWLLSPVTQLYNSNTTFTSSGGVVYSGPAFRCPAPDLPDFIQETYLTQFPVELLSHTLTRTRILVLDHIEQSFKDLLSSAVAMVTEKKEVVRLEQELSLTPEYIRTKIYEPRLRPVLATMLSCHASYISFHRQNVDTFSQEISEILTSCRIELHDLLASIHKKNLELFDLLTSRKLLEDFGAALQEQLDRHAEDTLWCQTNFKRVIRGRLEEARKRAGELQKSFRTFKEGGDFSAQEVKMFQKKMKEEIKRIGSTEDSIFSELEVFESKSLLQLRKVLAPLDDKFSSLQAEVKFTEEIQKIISRTQIQIKAEVAASSNLQQTRLSGRLEELREMMTNIQVRVSPDQICCSFSSVKEEIKSRCSYLGFSQINIYFRTFVVIFLKRPHFISVFEFKQRKTENTARGGFIVLFFCGKENDMLSSVYASVYTSLFIAGVLVKRTTSCLSDNKEYGKRLFSIFFHEIFGFSGIWSINTSFQDSVLLDSFALSRTKVQGAGLRRSRSATELHEETTVRFVEQLKLRLPRFTHAGPETKNRWRSFAAALNTILWWSNDTVLEAARVFYSASHVSTFSLVPESADIWAEAIQKRLLGYQEQGKKFLIMSKDEVVKQLSKFREMLDSLPEVLISHHVGQEGVWLTEELALVRKRLEEELAAGKEQKMSNLGRLRVSLKEDELKTLESKEERRQQQLHSAILRSHLELQECVRGRAEQFVTSLASLTEKLLHLLDEVLPAAEKRIHSSRLKLNPRRQKKKQEVSRSKPDRTAFPSNLRTWPGITHLFSLTSESAKSPITMTTAPISTVRNSQKHEAVIERRDTALNQRFEQLIHSEVSRSEADRRNQLSEQQNWISYWAQQVFALRQTQ